MFKFQLLTAMHADTVICVLICAHALSRLTAVWLMAALPYTKASGKAKPLATEISRRDFCVANLFGLLPLLVLLWLMQDAMGIWQVTLGYVFVGWCNWRWLGLVARAA
jgi:adenosylcobinamide-GDP ribazoletransferase